MHGIPCVHCVLNILVTGWWLLLGESSLPNLFLQMTSQNGHKGHVTLFYIPHVWKAKLTLNTRLKVSWAEEEIYWTFKRLHPLVICIHMGSQFFTVDTKAQAASMLSDMTLVLYSLLWSFGVEEQALKMKWNEKWSNMRKSLPIHSQSSESQICCVSQINCYSVWLLI